MRCSLFSTKAWLAALILGFCGTGTGPLRAAEKAPVGSEAYHLMMRAVNARATWNAVFPGFSADIKVNYKVQVLPNGKIKFTGVSEPHRRAWGWAHHWLSEIIFHRMGTQKSDAQYRSIRMIGGKNNPLGPLLAMDDPLNSSFRVEGKIIRQGNRDLPVEGSEHGRPRRVHISVLETTLTSDGKILPDDFVINYFDAHGQLTDVEAVSTRFWRLGHYELPQWRRVITTEDGKMITGEMVVTNQRLLQTANIASNHGNLH